MKLKYYGEYPNVQEAIKYYEKIFDFDVIKNTKTHGNILLYYQITLLLHNESSFRAKPGYYIIKFDDDEADKYMSAVKKIKASNSVQISIDMHAGKWGTTFFEFLDQYGYMWDLEINSSALF
ncbi:VOC family protein [Candidatus Mycoplasma mahonii]|uniref:VOC family protein n=1 Tax=Candidatus Mycoplasma mahonii TaxID=3004105 RepID=UPI0026EE279A|nr:VOC family protein [Candidatus Mycoplasma mahonii]WKX02385.1 hypothetical protein O3I44_03240 [Candidatus Mycoplasma mahonii]